MTVIRLIGFADGQASALEGCWLQSFDPDARDGHGLVKGTMDRADALEFVSPSAALDFWRQESTVLPLRPDGKPNRPLTAFSVELLP